MRLVHSRCTQYRDENYCARRRETVGKPVSECVQNRKLFVEKDVIRLPGRSYKNKKHVRVLKNNVRAQRQWRSKVRFSNTNHVIALKSAVFASATTRITYNYTYRKWPARVYTHAPCIVLPVKYVVYRSHGGQWLGAAVNVPAMIYRAKVAIYDARVYACGTRTGGRRTSART